jgi:hypothetical protein
VVVRPAETKANSGSAAFPVNRSSAGRDTFQVQTETQRKIVVERLVKTNLPPIQSVSMFTIDQTAYEFYKQALAILD